MSVTCEIFSSISVLQDFKVYMSEEFVEHCQEGALSIEVWGHKSLGFGHHNSVRDSVSRTNSLAER